MANRTRGMLKSVCFKNAYRDSSLLKKTEPVGENASGGNPLVNGSQMLGCNTHTLGNSGHHYSRAEYDPRTVEGPVTKSGL
jgi:hypothetical protein